jgi:hypothetical protein
MTATATLAGRLVLRPGQPVPNIQSTRPIGLTRLCAGRPADALPTLLASVFTLCGHAHKLAARLAVSAARGQAAQPTAAEQADLRLGTARDQILRLVHDWPRSLPGAPGADTVALHTCPLWQKPVAGRSVWPDLVDWLHLQLLGMSPTPWLQQHNMDPLNWAQHWCQQACTPLARLLTSQRLRLLALPTPGHSLNLQQASPAQLVALAHHMADPAFCGQPHWQGDVPDTGPWHRAHDPLGLPAHNAWMRLISRCTDLLRLATQNTQPWLATHAMAVAPHHGIAWVETARGLLVHAVQLDPASGGQHVARASVLAPTDWNFHPAGNLAQALATVNDAHDARRLAVAFDPCVEFVITPEAAHA